MPTTGDWLNKLWNIPTKEWSAAVKSAAVGEASPDGGGTGLGDHFLPHKYIKSSSTCGAISTKQLPNTGGGPRIPRKANQSLWSEVEQNIKTKRESKDLGTETHSGDAVVKEVSTIGSPLSVLVSAELWNLRRQSNLKKKKKRKEISTEFLWMAMPSGKWLTRLHLPAAGGGEGTGCNIGLSGKDRGWMPYEHSEGTNVM